MKVKVNQYVGYLACRSCGGRVSEFLSLADPLMYPPTERGSRRGRTKVLPSTPPVVVKVTEGASVRPVSSTA